VSEAKWQIQAAVSVAVSVTTLRKMCANLRSKQPKKLVNGANWADVQLLEQEPNGLNAVSILHFLITDLLLRQCGPFAKIRAKVAKTRRKLPLNLRICGSIDANMSGAFTR
jgi:hypothetical protein